MEKQKEILDRTFIEWKRDFDQLDDIMVIGARLKSIRDREITEKEWFTWPDRTILIVEDTEVNYFYLTEALKKTRVKIIRAEDGQKAIGLVEDRDDIDLILMDIDMPEMDGFTCSKKIKELKPHLPIVAQTAHNIDNLEKQTMEAGCDGYYTKPIQLKDLLNIIETHLK